MVRRISLLIAPAQGVQDARLAAVDQGVVAQEFQPDRHRLAPLGIFLEAARLQEPRLHADLSRGLRTDPFEILDRLGTLLLLHQKFAMLQSARSDRVNLALWRQ